MQKQISIPALFILLSLGACGSGSSSPPPSPPPPPPPPPAATGPVYTPGVYESASEFIGQCEVVRTGVDIEGNAYTDEPGSTLIEKFWLRSWTDETYLWPEDVRDLDPNDTASRTDYFQLLKSTEITESGEEKDDFHFSQSTEAYLAAINSAGSAGYGASYAVFSTTPPRDFRIRYTEPGSPAAETVMDITNLNRGTRILEVDGVDLLNANSQAEIDTLNAGLFPPTIDEAHTFLVQDVGAADTREITLISANIAPAPVNRTEIISTPTGDVGYILFNTFSTFSSEKAIADAMEDVQMAGVEDLVLDLRYNGGGLIAVAAQLGYMIAGPDQTDGRNFSVLKFNDAAGNRNPVTGNFNDPTPFYDIGLDFSVPFGTPLPRLDLGRVFILSTGRTCSASEAVINGLRGIDVEVILIGDITCGKPYGFYPTDNCGETYYTIQFETVNDLEEGGYSDGFVPDNSSFEFGVRQQGCVVADDFTRELGEPEEGLLAAALDYRETGTCPALPEMVSSLTASSSEKLGAGEGLPLRESALSEAEQILQNNLDPTMPGDTRN